jgi:hypothetical protein
MIESLFDYEVSSYIPTNNHTLILSDSLTLKVYSDNKPKNMRIADLQKGLLLSCNGIEVIGEGSGFGVPIAKYSDDTFFSGSSFLHVRSYENRLEIRKEFLMNLVARDRFRNLKLENPRIRKVLDYISKLYQRHEYLAKIILNTKGLLPSVGVQSSFEKSPQRGSVVVTYVIEKNRISVKLNLHKLEQKNLSKVFVLNEQGAHFFRIYSDSEGLKLVDEEIGAWKNVLASSAKIVNAESKIGFCLKTVEGSILRRGREQMKESLNWIGLDYELDPQNQQFEYEIELFG